MLPELKEAAQRHWRASMRKALAWLEDDGLDDPASIEPTDEGVLNPYQQFEAFRRLLPHAGYMPDHGLFMLDSPQHLDSKINPRRIEALGFTLELSPLAGAPESLRTALKNIIMQCPNGTGVQFTAFGDPRTQAVLDAYRSQVTNPEYVEAVERRAQFWAKAATTNIFKGLPYRLRVQRLLVSAAVPVDDFTSKHDVERVLALRESIEGMLSKEQMMPQRWTPESFLEWMDYMAHPHQNHQSVSSTRQFVYNPLDYLRDQAITADMEMRIRPKHLVFGEGTQSICVRALSTKEYPQEAYLHQAADLLGDQMNAANQYPCPYIITLGVQAQDFDATRQMAKVKAARATTNAESYMAKFLPEMREKRNDWDTMTASYERGEGQLRLFHQVLLFAKPDEIDAAQRNAEQVWRSRKYTLQLDRYMQMQGYLSSIPLMLCPSFLQDIELTERYHTKTVANAADTAPVVGDWRGFGQPKIVLWSRSGSPMFVDFFSNTYGNYNVACAAGSGAGKSVFGNELIRSVRMSGGTAYVIDAGHSYEKPCKQADGQFIEFSEGVTPCFNPFAMIRDLGDEEALSDVVMMITGMVNSMAAPDRALTDYEKGIVEQVVQAEVAELGTQGTVSGIYNRLIQFKNNQTGNPEPVAGQLAQAMRSYTQEGVFGRYFHGHEPIKFNSTFVVLELDGLSNAPRLQSTVLMIVMFQITQAMYEDRSKYKLILIDEAWALMRDGATGYFIEAMYRRCRKYKGSAVTITQSFADYFRNTTAMAAFSNSDFRVSLRQTQEALEDAFKEKRFVASEPQRQMLKSLITEAGKYAEIMISGPMGWGVGRLMLDKYSLLQFSTKPEDYEAIKGYRDQGLNINEAILSVMRDRGWDEQATDADSHVPTST